MITALMIASQVVGTIAGVAWRLHVVATVLGVVSAGLWIWALSMVLS